MGEARKTGPPVRVGPEGDDRERLVCPDCGFVSCENPKIVAGSVASTGGSRFAAGRSRRGFRTLPAGRLELRETAEEGAEREAEEEACARIEGPLAVYAVPRISRMGRGCRRASLAAPRRWRSAFSAGRVERSCVPAGAVGARALASGRGREGLGAVPAGEER